MSSPRPPAGFKRPLAERECHHLAYRTMNSTLGQQALHQGWARGLYAHVIAWGSTPSRPETITALKRDANDFMWELAEMRRIIKPDPLQTAGLRFMEAAALRELELRDKFMRTEAAVA